MNNRKTRFGFLLTEEKTDKLFEICFLFKKSPEKFINDIIESTYLKTQILNLDWENDE